MSCFDSDQSQLLELTLQRASGEVADLAAAAECVGAWIPLDVEATGGLPEFRPTNAVPAGHPPISLAD